MSDVCFDMRIVGHATEIKEFISLCRVIQQLGRTGSSRDITVSVDGDGSGRLAFFGINHGEEAANHGRFTELNSSKVDPDKIDTICIGE